MTCSVKPDQRAAADAVTDAIAHLIFAMRPPAPQEEYLVQAKTILSDALLKLAAHDEKVP